jgi:hypothetical protein
VIATLLYSLAAYRLPSIPGLDGYRLSFLCVHGHLSKSNYVGFWIRHMKRQNLWAKAFGSSSMLLSHSHSHSDNGSAQLACCQHSNIHCLLHAWGLVTLDLMTVTKAFKSMATANSSESKLVLICFVPNLHSSHHSPESTRWTKVWPSQRSPFRWQRRPSLTQTSWPAPQLRLR